MNLDMKLKFNFNKRNRYKTYYRSAYNIPKRRK